MTILGSVSARSGLSIDVPRLVLRGWKLLSSKSHVPERSEHMEDAERKQMLFTWSVTASERHGATGRSISGRLSISGDARCSYLDRISEVVNALYIYHYTQALAFVTT